MSLRDQIILVLAQARSAGGEVISIAAVEGVVARYDAEQRQLTARALQRMPEVKR